MTFALDNLQRSRLDWPEPLVLELIGEIYAAHDDGDRWTAVRLHARFLREIVEDAKGTPTTSRLELIASCAARGIGAETIELAEQAVFSELTHIIAMRFRNSPRLRDGFLGQIRDAQQALPRRPETPRKPAAPVARRPALRLRPSLIPTAA